MKGRAGLTHNPLTHIPRGPPQTPEPAGPSLTLSLSALWKSGRFWTPCSLRPFLSSGLCSP